MTKVADLPSSPEMETIWPVVIELPRPPMKAHSVGLFEQPAILQLGVLRDGGICRQLVTGHRIALEHGESCRC